MALTVLDPDSGAPPAGSAKPPQGALRDCVEPRALLAIELCGRLADPLGPVLHLAIPREGCTVAELIVRLIEDQPWLARHFEIGRVRICVNEGIAGTDEHLSAEDRVALFPPVSGG